MSSDYGVVTRLTRLLALLGDEPVDRDDLIDKLPDEYGADIETMQRAFRRDIQALVQMGFDLRRYGGRPPRYSLHGHLRWPTTTAKTCPSCKRMLPMTMFGMNRARRDGRNVYCLDCMRRKGKETYTKYRVRYLKARQAHTDANRDQRRATDRETHRRRMVRIREVRAEMEGDA